MDSAAIFAVFLALPAAFVSPAGAAALSSNGAGGGNWSNSASWNPVQTPTSADTVVIAPGDTITVNVTNAAASTVTVNGTLTFSRVASSSLTLVGGGITVNPGGTLDMGTDASPIPSSLFAHLVLASGSPAFFLLVNDGGNISVRGATKSPYALATAAISAGATSLTVPSGQAVGWKPGDTIVISPNAPAATRGPSGAESRVITSTTSGNPVTVSWSGGLAQARNAPDAEFPIVVANLDRNVLIRSSSTVSATQQRVESLASAATSFYLAYAELSYLGRTATGVNALVIGIGGTSASGSISSCTFRNLPSHGVGLGKTSNLTLDHNVFYGNTNAAGQQLLGVSANSVGAAVLANAMIGNTVSQIIGLEGAQHAVTGNYLLSNASDFDLYLTNGPGAITLSGNYVSFNTETSGSLVLQGPVAPQTYDSNRFYANNLGVSYRGATSLLVSAANRFAYTSASGLTIDGSLGALTGLTAVGDRLWSNSGGYSIVSAATGMQAADVWLGYDTSGAAVADTAGNSAEIAFAPAGQAENLTLWAAHINPAVAVATAGLSVAGNYLLSYGQDYSTASVRLQGDYLLSGSTWTLDYASQLYASTATAVQLLRGTGHSATVCSTSDASAVSQLISIRRAGSSWQVVGSSSGLLGTIASGGSCPGSSFGQFNLVLSQGASPAQGDRLDFALIAASADAGTQKKLLLGPVASSLNGGKPRLSVAATGGLVLKGTAGAPTLMDMTPGGTYYTFIDSGAFTAQSSSITNADSDGIQLSGTSGISLDTVGFDFMGIAKATNTYITARTLTSVSNFNNVAFWTSRSTGPAARAYNVLVTGVDTGLNWTFNAPALGPLWGSAFESDPNNRVAWGVPNIPPSSPAISQVYLSSLTVTFGAVGAPNYVADASTDSNFNGTLFSAQSPSATTLTIGSLTQNTTYFVRVGALWGATTFYANASPAQTATLAASPDPLNFTAISLNGFTVNWQQNLNPAGTRFEVAVSTDIGFTVFTASQATTATSFTPPPLTGNATFYARARAVNQAGTPSAYALGAVITASGVITISASRLPSLWYNLGSAIFNAQGAPSYRYKLDSVAGYVPTGADTLYDGAALTLALPQGVSYFHVSGYNGATFVGSAQFGPLLSDGTSPTIASISAQKSLSDSTPLSSGQTTTAPIPHFFWPAAVSVSPIVGYSFSVSTDSSVNAPLAVNTTLTFADFPFGFPGLYYAKVRAENLAGNWSAPVSMSLNYSLVPTATQLLLKKNYFSPSQGQCSTLELQLASAGKVKAELYTLLGQRVATLADEDATPGVRSYRWCGRNRANEPVATGVYLLRVTTPDQKTNFKVIVAQ